MFLVNFAKFVRPPFIKKTKGTPEIHRLTKSNIKNYVKSEIKKIFWETLSICTQRPEHFDS